MGRPCRRQGAGPRRQRQGAQGEDRGLLKTWIQNGMFVVVEGLDEKREKRSYIEVGTWADDLQ